MNDKYSFQQGDATIVKNQDLDCSGCVFAYRGNVSECIAFHQKPLSVLKGNVCPKRKERVE